jgi:S-(hydroxymethyl)glutathione dehydrogenase / alcohol dehydrogenase
MKAAILRAYKEPLSIEDIQIDDPGPRELRIRTCACGVCHSDLHYQQGALQMPLPTVLGHEPAGIVLAVGRDVAMAKVGDHVVACGVTYCGHCDHCQRGEPNLCNGAGTRRKRNGPSRLSLGGETINQMGQAAFAEEMLVHESCVVKINPEMPIESAALIGCGVITGVGAVLNAAKLRPGETCVVIGCGGIGLNAIQGAKIAGAGRIIAIDMIPWKLELAKVFGATDCIDASAGDAVERLLELMPVGADYAFECIGTPATIRKSVAMVRKGGTAIIIGVVPLGVDIAIDGNQFLMNGKRMIAAYYGGASFRSDVPRYVDYYLKGHLRLDEMISDRIQLKDVNKAFDDLIAGKSLRQVITFD